MRKHLAALLPLLTAPLLCANAAEPQFRPEGFRAHVAFLADDLLEGRDTGSRGHEIAARYVAAQFEAYGLRPGGDVGSWFQSVTLQKTERGTQRGTVTVSGPAGMRRWPNGGDVIVGLNPQAGHIDLDAPVVFVGYGIENDRLGLNDYQGLDVKGRIVVALSGFPKGMSSEEGAHVAATKAQAAQRHGAIGFVGIGTLQSIKVHPWEQVLRYVDTPDFDWVGADGKVFQEAPGILASASLNTPAAVTLFAGSGHTLEAVRQEADRTGGRPKGFALKTQLRIEVDSRMSRVTSPNVIGVLPGGDPSLAGQYVVLSAHLDHLGISPEDPSHPDADRINNGALDNASGVATMLEVARALAAAPQRPRRSVIFLASTGEEKGLLGADYYARHPTVPIERIVGDVDLDMPVLLYPFTDLIAFGANHSSLGRIVSSAAAPMGIALSPDPMPEQGIFVRSDHYMFVRQGVPAVFLVTGYANGGEKAWDAFFAGAYHHPDDDLKQPIDWNAGARFAEVNYRITRAMADDDDPPRWLEGDFFGDSFAPKAARAPRR